MVQEQNLDNGLQYLKNQLRHYQFSNIENKKEKFGVSVSCELDDKKYCILLIDNIYELPMVLVEVSNDMYPHMSFEKAEHLGSDWKSLCLNIKNQYIIYQMTIEAKIDCTLEQLLGLLNLSKIEIKEEFDKEFDVYWRQLCQKTYKSYLGEFEKDNEVKLLIPTAKDNSVIIIGRDYYRRDENAKYRNETGYFVKIFDFSDIYPPCHTVWDKKMMKNIFCSLKYTRFDDLTHKFLKKLYVKGTATIIFELPFNNNLQIGLQIQFSDTQKGKFLEKIKNGDYEIKFIAVDKLNIEHSVLRNGDDLLSLMNVAMIGCGSLGSYVYKELLNTNVKKFTLIDGDRLRPENLSRHILNSAYINLNKAQGLQFYSNLDKSIHTIPITKDLTYANVSNLLNNQESIFDMAVVTVGNEDVQHMINNYIYTNTGKFVPTLFCWLEANGIGFHVLAVVERNKGCYHCIQEYKRVNDRFKYIKNEHVPIFNNGCGGSYTHYGSSALLEATSLILKVIREFSNGNITTNKIYSLKAIADSKIATTEYYINQKDRIQMCSDIYFKGCKYCGDV